MSKKKKSANATGNKNVPKTQPAPGIAKKKKPRRKPAKKVAANASKTVEPGRKSKKSPRKKKSANAADSKKSPKKEPAQNAPKNPPAQKAGIARKSKKSPRKKKSANAADSKKSPKKEPAQNAAKNPPVQKAGIAKKKKPRWKVAQKLAANAGKTKRDSPRPQQTDMSKYIDASSAGVKALHVDALNLELFPNAATAFQSPYTILKSARKRVKLFVRAAEKSGVKLTAFIDAARKTDEAREKWYSRRVKEVRTGKRRILQGQSTMLGDLLRAEGVVVHYSIVDNDDTLAAHAYADGASVLSADKDFFRYVPEGGGEGAPYSVYSDYHVSNGRLLLRPHPHHKARKELKRQVRSILSPPPRSEARDPSMVTVKVEKKYVRGIPFAPLAKLPFLPNPHHTARPLRRALYGRMGVGAVEEEWPVFDPSARDKVAFPTTLVTASSKLDALLDTPKAAYERLFGGRAKPAEVSELHWQQLVFAQKSIVFELCLAGGGLGPDASLFSLLMDDHQTPSPPPPAPK